MRAVRLVPPWAGSVKFASPWGHPRHKLSASSTDACRSPAVDTMIPMPSSSTAREKVARLRMGDLRGRVCTQRWAELRLGIFKVDVPRPALRPIRPIAYPFSYPYRSRLLRFPAGRTAKQLPSYPLKASKLYATDMGFAAFLTGHVNAEVL